MDRESLKPLVFAAVEELFETQTDAERPESIDEDLPLIGQQAVFDSIAFVALIADIEQRIDEEHGLFLTLVDEKAMSMRRSPFRTVGTLLEHIENVARDTDAD